MLSRYAISSLKLQRLNLLKNTKQLKQAEKHFIRHYHNVLNKKHFISNSTLKLNYNRPYYVGMCMASTDVNFSNENIGSIFTEQNKNDVVTESSINNVSATEFDMEIASPIADATQSFLGDNLVEQIIAENKLDPPVHEGFIKTVSAAELEKDDGETVVNSLIDSIPDPPAIPSIPEPVLETIKSYSGEPPFAELGLGGWSPVGIVQNCMEYLHIGLDLPWWTSILIGTICVRIIIFPLVIIAQRNAAKMNNHMPELQSIQLKMTEARQTGNQLDAAKYAQEMMQFMKDKQVNPIKNMVVPLAQMPLFVSFFMGLRGMANVPVDSMRTGGMMWFTDLTMPDPFYLLPIITSVTMWITIEVGTDAARLSSQNLQTMRYVLRALPVCILPFTIHFPGAILCYWVSTNFISLLQVGFLRIPSVREYFKIDPLVTHNPENLPVKPKPFVAGMKESWNNMKIAREMEDRERFDDMQFQRAGRGPIIKTYKHDPTKSASSKNTIVAKKREY